MTTPEDDTKQLRAPRNMPANAWVKYPGNPVLGRELGTCFDVSVHVADGRHRIWFSWRPKKGIGYAESDDGLHWKPLPDVVLHAGDHVELLARRP